MEILMVALEIAPYVCGTPAADAIASLGKALRQLGHNVTVVAPRQPGFESAGLLLARRLTPLPLPDGGEVHVLDAQLPSGVQLTLFDAPVLFDRPFVYGDEAGDYADNARRFALLSQAAAALVRQREQQGKAFDIVHLHDAPAALVPLALGRTPGPSVPCVLTVHDVRRQGDFERADAEGLLGLLGHDSDDVAMIDGRINLLKAGISTADALTTVSVQYATEMASAGCSGALAEVVTTSSKPIVGIVDGIDYAVYNPATDAALPSRYDAEDPANKAVCKGSVLKALELDVELERPLLLHVVEDDPAGGFEQVLAALPALLKSDLGLVIAGQVGASAQRKLKAARTRHRDTFAWVEKADAAALRRLTAAADLSLHTRRHVPCATPELVSQRYGAAPVALAVGGVLDSVVDCDATLDTGTGFLFDDETPEALVAAVGRGLSAFASAGWSRLRRRIMRLDVGWDRPARRYLQVHRHALASLA